MRHVAFLVLLGSLVGCNTLRLGVPAPEAGEAVVAPPPLVELWERNVEAAFGPAAPSVLGDQVLVSTRQGDLVLLNAATGQVDGKQSFGDSVEGAVAFSDNRRLLFVGAAQPGQVIAHDLTSGERAWRWRSRDLGTPDAGVVQSGGVVVAPLTDGTIVGLDAATGDMRWSTRPDTTATYAAAPVVYAGGVALADDRGTVRLLDPQTGDRIWTVLVGGPVEHTPAMGADGTLFVPTTRGDMGQVREGGRIGWRVSFTDPADRVAPRTGPPVWHASGLVVAGATNGRVQAIDAASGAVRWTRDLDAHVNGTPLVSGGFVFVGTTDRRVLALDIQTGEPRWEATVRGRVKSGLAAADGMLFVLTEPRHVVAFGPPAP